MPAGGAIGWWRHVALAGLIAGLLFAPGLGAPAGWLPCGVALAAGLVAVARAESRAGSQRAARGYVLLVAVALVAALFGWGAGAARVASIDAGALHGRPGDAIGIQGWVTAVPSRDFGEVRVQVDAAQGRVVAVAPEPVPDLPVGAQVEVRGHLARPDDFRASQLARVGADLELRTGRIELTGATRGGPAGLLDGIRIRAERALGEGMEADRAALARGFVLGQDDRIDAGTAEEFRRAGLSHLLAVSGQNVMLLAILVGTALAVFGVGVRARLLITIAAIAVFVPVAGAGPSIQRAGIMGAAAIAATLAGRPADRAYPPLLAAASTLLINPRFGGDAGWQLSFAAVVGIMLWAAPLRELVDDRLHALLPGPVGRGLSDGVAMTLAATVATAPLIAHDFERLSVASVPANVLVLPAVAPVMWLGMLIGVLGQLPGVPLAPLGACEGTIVGYVARVATELGSPQWAQAEIALPSAPAVIGVYLLVSGFAAAAIASLRRRRHLRLPRGLRPAPALCLLVALVAVAFGGHDDGGPTADTTEIVELDVGQGDATLIRPPRGAPLLVDTGPPGDAAAESLRDRGIDRLRAVIVTHDERDHAGGLAAVLAAVAVDEVVLGRRSPRVEAAARAAGARVSPVAEGSSIAFGALRIDFLWPPRDHVDNPIAAPNDDSLVLAARFRGYDALITGDAEAEATHLDPGPFDVLKVAHHGSDDAGLAALLDRSVPRVALIGVGAGNGYGHPTAGTLAALADHGVCTLRTDLDGAATVRLGPSGVAVSTERGGAVAGRPGCGPGGA